MSKAESGFGGSYGHSWRVATAAELVRFDGVLIRDGVLGSSNGAIYRRFQKGGCCYSKEIDDAMTASRYGQLKLALKLCHNGSAPKRGHANYDPAYKYDLIYKCIVHNCNEVSKYADENQVIDESTWGHSGYGESGTGLTGRLMNKKVSKGGQVVISSDLGRCRPRAYLHRHKVHDYPKEFTRMGTGELHHLASSLLQMVIDPTAIQSDSKKKIFRKKMGFTVDNCFVCDKGLEWAGKAGIGVIGTNARNCLPKDIDSRFLQVNKTKSGDSLAKAAKFVHPICCSIGQRWLPTRTRVIPIYIFNKYCISKHAQ